MRWRAGVGGVAELLDAAASVQQPLCTYLTAIMRVQKWG